MMHDKITLYPSEIGGRIQIPTSKSLAHRSILAAALAKGRSVVTNISMSDDIEATISIVEALGGKVNVEGSTLYIDGIENYDNAETVVNCNESGSTIRFIIPILSLFSNKFTVKGKQSLIARPQSIYEDIFKDDTFNVGLDNIEFQGTLVPKTYEVPGNISSQFITGLLLVLPLLDGDSKIVVTNKFESKDYVQLTLDVLSDFGIEIEHNDNEFIIKGNQTYKPCNYEVEGDYSQSGFWLVNGAINSTTILTNMNLDSNQGDKGVLEVLKASNIDMTLGSDLVVNPTTPSETVVSLANIPDLGPILALLASQGEGTTRFTDIERLRIKESDRVESTIVTLKKMGVNIEEINGEIVVVGPSQIIGGGTLDSYNDHRIAMMISIAAGVATAPITLLRATSVNKSYPKFFEDYKNLGGKYTVEV